MNTKSKRPLLSFPKPKFTTGMIRLSITLLFSTLCIGSFGQKKSPITVETLLEEMTSYDEMTRYPALPYRSMQQSSYDRRSVSPDRPGWFANDDGEGFIRLEEHDGRKEKVLFEDEGPGAITRIWLTTFGSIHTILRFYFDGKDEPGWVVPSYDLQKFGVRGLKKGLIEPDDKWIRGSLIYLPITYADGCKVTMEELTPERTNRHFLFNYRKYPTGTPVETFSRKVAERIPQSVEKTSATLYRNIDKGFDPQARYGKGALIHRQNLSLNKGEKQQLNLHKGKRAISLLQFNVKTDPDLKPGTDDFARLMRSLIISISFDGQQTVWAPLSDFAGSGMGAFASRSFFFYSDGKGIVCSKWLMPYRQNCEISVLNLSPYKTDVHIDIVSQPYKWDNRSLYFHTVWKQERGLPVVTWMEHEKCMDWNFTTISGRGVYRGDLLSLFNHTTEWYGEGDEKITVDHEAFPSHFGTGTEDYYSFDGYFKSQTPFAGQPRQDMKDFYGYNSFFRVRCLDGIPFNQQLKFDFELLGWENGTVDYSSTVFWYGDLNSQAAGSSGIEEIEAGLLPTPTQSPVCSIANAIDFCQIQPTSKSERLRYDRQRLSGHPGKWNLKDHLVCHGGKKGDYIEFEFSGFEDHEYSLNLFCTKAADYGNIKFYVNRQENGKQLDCYSQEVEATGAINLGMHKPIDGKFILRIELTGQNALSTGTLFGLDCIRIE
jgi:hypothetical protein